MIFAHGVGSRGDLPLPLWIFTWAAAIALVLSFVALGVLWTRPLLAGAGVGRLLVRLPGVAAVRSAVGAAAGRAPALVAAGPVAPALPVEAATVAGGYPGAGLLRSLQAVGKAAALALFLVCLAAGLFGADDTSDNLLPVTLYVVVWVGAQLVGGLVGDLWAAVNPLATLARLVEAALTRLGRPPGPPPARLGQWPAAAGLAVFLFYELAHPSGAQPRTLGWMLAVHTLVTLVLAARWGAGWVAHHEPFSALLGWLGAMAPVFRRDDGLALRPPMTGLARLPVEPGTLAGLLIVLGGTSYDGFGESQAGRELLGPISGWGGAVTEALALTGSVAVIGALFGLGIVWTSRVTSASWRETATAFTPSLVPIVFGYGVAHYAQLLVDEIQTFVFRLSDPFGAGWNLFGGADGQIDFTLLSPDVVAWIQVLAILFGHVGAVTVAHDRSVELFDPGQSLRSQFAMLIVMVAYSTLGLWLLLNA